MFEGHRAFHWTSSLLSSIAVPVERVGDDGTCSDVRAPGLSPSGSCDPAGDDQVSVLEVVWPDGSWLSRVLQPEEMNSVVEVGHPKEGETTALASDAQVETLARRRCSPPRNAVR